MRRENRCPHCGANMRRYTYQLTPGLVGILVKMYDVARDKGQNEVYRRELDLTHTEHTNFTKVRFFALIAKLKRNGKRVEGAWCITGWGFRFLRGELELPKYVKTYRNKIVERFGDWIGRSSLPAIPIFQDDFPWEPAGAPLPDLFLRIREELDEKDERDAGHYEREAPRTETEAL